MEESFRRHGLKGTTKQRVFDALLERQDGRCFICGISQAELETKAQEHAATWAERRKKEAESGETQSEAFTAWLAEHEEAAKRHERRKELERTLSQEELATWRQKRNAVHSTLHIDHCHTSGMIRGLLCEHCNYLLGLVENAGLLQHYTTPAFQYEPPDMELQRLIDYFRWQVDEDWLERHRDTILLYMQQERWLPRKDILFHLMNAE